MTDPTTRPGYMTSHYETADDERQARQIAEQNQAKEEATANDDSA